MFNEKARKKILDHYGIDVIEDVFLAEDYHLVFCFDFNKKEEAQIMILKGDIGIFGVKQSDSIYVKQIMEIIDLDNPLTDVIGKDNYIEYLFSQVGMAQEIPDIYFPIKSKNGTIWVVCSMKTIVSNEVERLVYGRINWISKETPDAVKFYESNYKDKLTGLFSKEALKYHLQRARLTDHSYGLYFDVDNFKRINDIFGHNHGDKYLIDLGNKFREFASEHEIYYRIGGDEFFVYLINSTEKEAHDKAVELIYEIERLNCDGEQAEVSASVGIVPIIGSDFNIDNLLNIADRTMYHAKQKGKGNISYVRDV